jgi:sugar transferase EpsL
MSYHSKRVFDITLATLVLIACLPVLFIVFILIRRNLGSPVIFQQTRPGQLSKPFTLYKFRTMTNDKDSWGNLLPDSERLTPLGVFLRSTSLDELPELFNVLLGDMSLVGPRPLLMEYLDRYNPDQARRHEVKPGITGWAQVNGRNAITWGKKFALDVWYVDNQSLQLDLRIVFLTILKVLKCEGINHPGRATMEKFGG